MKNKNGYRVLVLLLTANCLCACVNLDNPQERNELVFNDSISSIADSINVMNEILLKYEKGICSYWVSVDMNNLNRNENDFFLYIMDRSRSVQKVGIITDTLLYKSQWLQFLDDSDKKRFINLVLYLNKNYLSSGGVDINQVFYGYQDNIYMADRQTDLCRTVVYAKLEQEIDVNYYKILDKCNNLYLLADKDAKIWSSE